MLRYAPGENLNGSLHDIAGVSNEAGNVFGLMPHPEHAVERAHRRSTDGLCIFALDAPRRRGGRRRDAPASDGDAADARRTRSRSA